MILIIDDEQPLLEEIVERLHFENIEAMGATSGTEGVDLARRYRPELIICDVTMPGMDGIEVFQALRGDSSTAFIPFIFLSARAEKDDYRRGMELGADDYITKPFTYAQLLAAIRTRLAKKATIEAANSQAFARGLVINQDIERREIARRMDSVFTKRLASLKMTLSLAHQLSDEPLEESIFGAELIVEDLMRQVDSLVMDLSPEILDHLGLLPAVLWQIRSFTTRTSIRIDFNHGPVNRDFDVGLKLSVYRLLQEALANIAKHAGVEQARVVLWTDDESLRLDISDSGRGFSLELLHEAGATHGLHIMAERARALGGELVISSSVGAGTTLSVRWPLTAVNSHRHEVPLRTSGILVAETPPPAAVKDETPPEKQEQASIRVLIAEEQEIVRQGLRQLIESSGGFEVVCETDRSDELVNQLEALRPDLLLLDFSVPGINTYGLVEQLRRTYPALHIALLSPHSESIYAVEALQRGATGYVLKSCRADEFQEAVRKIARGDRFISSGITMEDETRFGQAAHEPDRSDIYWSLTEREREILILVASGLTNQEIAGRLVIGVRTVETHRANVMRKLDARNVSDLVLFAVKHGLLSVGKAQTGPLS